MAKPSCAVPRLCRALPCPPLHATLMAEPPCAAPRLYHAPPCPLLHAAPRHRRCAVPPRRRRCTARCCYASALRRVVPSPHARCVYPGLAGQLGRLEEIRSEWQICGKALEFLENEWQFAGQKEIFGNPQEVCDITMIFWILYIPVE